MHIQEKIKKLIKEALAEIDIQRDEVGLEHPSDYSKGDYSSNVAFALAKELKKSPASLAEDLAQILNSKKDIDIAKVEAVSGFINFFLSQEFYSHNVIEILENEDFGKNNFLPKKIMIEYTDPNPFKPFHIGHLMTNAIGESLARISEYSGAKVARANYQGDVGLHVAKAIYVLLENKKEYIKKDAHVNDAAVLIGKAYAKGAQAYEDDAEAKQKIDEINKKIYEKVAGHGDKEINEVYDWGFKVTMEAFENLYTILGTEFDFYFLESEMAPLGQKIVKENTGKVFKESDGAIIFKGEEHDPRLHTRVFLTKTGLPTYEAKELGLTQAKFEARRDLDLSIVVTANEQADYMRVVAKAISIIHPEYEERMLHLAHGMMRFKEGKMGSRKGNVITGEAFLEDIKILIEAKIKDRDLAPGEKEKIATSVAVAAIKYGILKQSTKGDIIFDAENATSFEGDSGPYLQYSYARARSILTKAETENLKANALAPESWQTSEIEKILYKFPEVVLRAAMEFEPHYIATYLIELARAFNGFYGNTQIIDKNDPTSPYKIALTEAFSKIMHNGLHLLGIQAPEKM